MDMNYLGENCREKSFLNEVILSMLGWEKGKPAGLAWLFGFFSFSDSPSLSYEDEFLVGLMGTLHIPEHKEDSPSHFRG